MVCSGCENDLPFFERRKKIAKWTKCKRCGALTENKEQVCDACLRTLYSEETFQRVRYWLRQKVEKK